MSQKKLHGQKTSKELLEAFHNNENTKDRMLEPKPNLEVWQFTKA